MTVLIRRATTADRPAWSTLRAALWPDAGAAEHETEIDASLTNAGSACFVAVTGDQTIGFAEATIRHDPVNGCDTSPVGFLEGIYVAPAQRRSGVARLLLGEVEHWAAAQGCTELGSDSEVGNAHGRAFHLGAGFDEREVVICYRKPLGRWWTHLGSNQGPAD